MPFWLAALFGFLIVARITRFVNDDFLAAPIREAVMKRFGAKGKLYYLATCPWCLSIYSALPVAVIVPLVFGDFGAFGTLWAAGGLWLGYSYVYGLVAGNFDE